MTDPRMCGWPLKYPNDDGYPWVDFGIDYDLRLHFRNVAYHMSRREARLLAKRINAALDYHAAWNKSKKRKDRP